MNPFIIACLLPAAFLFMALLIGLLALSTRGRRVAPRDRVRVRAPRSSRAPSKQAPPRWAGRYGSDSL
jgi:hypothetical protein